MSILSALLFFHAGLFRAGLFITVIIAIWGLVIYIRKLPPSGGFRSTLVLTEGLFIVQGLVGIAMFLGTGSASRAARLRHRRPVHGGADDPRLYHGRVKKEKGPFRAPFVTAL